MSIESRPRPSSLILELKMMCPSIYYICPAEEIPFLLMQIEFGCVRAQLSFPSFFLGGPFRPFSGASSFLPSAGVSAAAAAPA